MSAPTADVVIRGAIRPWSCDGEESPGKAKSPDMTRNSAACRGDHICLVTVPTLAPAADLAAGAHPSSVAVDDFNRAGVADLAVTDYGFDTVLVLLGRGDGTFQAAVNYALGSHPWSVADCIRGASVDQARCGLEWQELPRRSVCVSYAPVRAGLLGRQQREYGIGRGGVGHEQPSPRLAPVPAVLAVVVQRI